MIKSPMGGLKHFWELLTYVRGERISRLQVLEMGSRGPKPQPIAILKAKGTINVTRANDQIADANALDWVHDTIPTPPEDLSDDIVVVLF